MCRWYWKPINRNAIGERGKPLAYGDKQGGGTSVGRPANQQIHWGLHRPCNLHLWLRNPKEKGCASNKEFLVFIHHQSEEGEEAT